MKRSFRMMDVDTPTIAKRTRRGSFIFRKASTRALTPAQKAGVRSLIAQNSELKYFFNSQAATTVSSTSTIAGTLFDVPQGAADTNRIGDRLKWAGRIDLRLQVVNGQGGTGDIYNNVRVIIFQWHPNSNPGTTDILIVGPSTVVDIYSVYNHDKRQMYTILFDKTFTTVGNAQANTGNQDNITTGVRAFKIPLRRRKPLFGSPFQSEVQYSAGGLTGTNRLYYFVVSDSLLATHPTIALMTKVVFRDS